jgi:deferrochelatase/peroxidase EfeB
MAVVLDLADIQGNILTAYGKQGFPKGRCITLNVDDAAKARRFVTELMPMITTALRWKARRSNAPVGAIEMQRPKVAVNIAFTFPGLLALGVPVRTLRGMPDEFIDGMMNRASMLGDNFNRIDPMKTWDTVWTAAEGYRTVNPNIVHILITLNAQMNPDGTPVGELDATTKIIEDLCAKTGGLRVLPGHSQPDEKEPAKYQELTAITVRLDDGTVVPCAKEHFGYTDGIGDPIFEAQYPARHERQVAHGNGAVDGTGKWRPLATGEFLLGYPDEAQEIPGSALPLDFSRNGTFMAYRKLHQNVVAFSTFMTETAKRFGAVFGINDPEDARAALMAKIAGRWPDGVPVARAPTVADWKKFNIQFPDVSPTKDLKAYLAREQAFIDFTYADDMGGLKCPMTSHVRRTNTRDGLAPTGREGSALNNRRRIIRRGLPYGDSAPGVPDSAEHGIIMLIVCASLFRQFEFVQQQWINYGLDAQAGNDACPLVGNHSPGNELTGPKAKYVIPADPKAGHPPFIVEGIPQFVETRGGDYFFVPSMTALRMIGMGTVDPT